MTLFIGYSGILFVITVAYTFQLSYIFTAVYVLSMLVGTYFGPLFWTKIQALKTFAEKAHTDPNSHTARSAAHGTRLSRQPIDCFIENFPHFRRMLRAIL